MTEVQAGAHDVHQVAVGHSKDVLQTSDIAFCFDIQRELLTCAHHAVAE